MANSTAAALEMGKNESAKNGANAGNNGSEGAPQAANSFEQLMQLATGQLVRTLITGGVATLGFTWILLGLYTFIKDLSQFKFLADPGDLFFFLLPPKAALQVPDSIKSMPRLGARLVIYPVAGFIAMIYGTIIVLMVMVAYAIVNPFDTAFSVIKQAFGL